MELNDNTLHESMSLEDILCVWPGTANEDVPLPNIAGFDRLSEEGDKQQIRWLVKWIAPQTTCAYILRHHHSDGLRRVLRGLAKACDTHSIHMGPRVGAMASAMGLRVI